MGTAKHTRQGMAGKNLRSSGASQLSQQNSAMLREAVHVSSLTISMEYGKSSGSTVMELGMLTTCSRATPQQKWHANLAACMT